MDIVLKYKQATMTVTQETIDDMNAMGFDINRLFTNSVDTMLIGDPSVPEFELMFSMTKPHAFSDTCEYGIKIHKRPQISASVTQDAIDHGALTGINVLEEIEAALQKELENQGNPEGKIVMTIV